MKSVALGLNTSGVEVTNVSGHGFWLYIEEREMFVAFDQFPWFRNASISEIADVQLPTPNHLYWAQLDIDLTVASLIHPENYPLVSSAQMDPLRQHSGPRSVEEQQANKWLAEAHSLAQAGHCESALVMAWAGLEPAMRVAAMAHDVASERVISSLGSASLVRALISNRIVTGDWDERLTELLRLRSAFAHGIHLSVVPAEAALREAVESIHRLAEQLLSEAPRD